MQVKVINEDNLNTPAYQKASTTILGRVMYFMIALFSATSTSVILTKDWYFSYIPLGIFVGILVFRHQWYQEYSKEQAKV